MEISDVETLVVRLPTGKIFRGRAGEISPDRMIVKVHTDEGLIGLGSIDIAPIEFGYDAAVLEHNIHTHMKPVIVGLDPFSMEEIHRKINEVIEYRVSPYLIYGERSGIDLALYDLMGKSVGLPVNKLLGGAVTDKVAVAHVLGIDTPERTGEEAERYAALGYFDFKMKVGLDPATDLDRVRAVRRAIGDDRGLRLDVNSGWSVNEALRNLKKMEKYDIELVEDPIHYRDFEGMAYLRSRLEIPLMIDMGVFSPRDLFQVMKYDATDIVNIKILRSGGLHTARKVLAVAESGDLDCMLGGELEIGMGTAAGLHFASTSEAFKYPADLLGFMYYKDDVIKERFEFKDGYVSIPSGPGLGVTLDEEKVEKYRVR